MKEIVYVLTLMLDKVQQWKLPDNLTNSMEMFGMVLVTLFIPVGIFLLERRDFIWDKNVVLKYVIGPRLFTFAIACLFFPTFFWGLQEWRFLLLIIYMAGVIATVIILRRSYKWMSQLDECKLLGGSDYKNECRKKYLKNPRDWGAQAQIWQETWREKNLPLESERELLEIFISNINEIIKIKDEIILENLLYNFNQFIENRLLNNCDIFHLTYRNTLDWYCNFSSKKTFPSITHGELGWLINKLTEFSLKNKMIYFLFNDLRYHVSDKDETYLNHLFSYHICWQFYDYITLSEGNVINRNVIDHFPSVWKVTVTTFRDGNNKIAIIWWRTFCYWARKRLIAKKFDESLNYVVLKLFPTVDPYTWALLLRLKIMGLEEAINYPITFGTMGKIPVFHLDGSGHDFSQEKIQDVENTYQLAAVLTPELLSKYNIKKMQNELNNLDIKESEKYKLRIKEKYRQLLNELMQRAQS